MPLTRFIADALGVVTICLVAVLFLLGLFCIFFSFYLRTKIQRQGFLHLGYFSGPWIIRIALIFITIWWGFGEIVRLNLLRREGRILNTLDLKWQERVCKCYIVSNLGFAEPCLFLTLVFLLRASLQKMESGTLSQKWNSKTAGYVFLYCLPVFLIQLVVILIGRAETKLQKLPRYFTSTAAEPKIKDNLDNVAMCTYPLLSTLFLGLFATAVTVYLFWLGKHILNLVINKGLRKRVYYLIFVVSGFLPLRVLLLGLSVLSRPENLLFESLVFLAFLSLFCCAGVGIRLLVYCPVADSLALERVGGDVEGETVLLIGGSDRNTTSTALGVMEGDGISGAFVELGVFSGERIAGASRRTPVKC